MESLLHFACAHAHSAHWIFFLLLMLAGFNIPISEDLILLTGGAIASLCIPEHTLHLFIWIYAGCWLSAWIAYSIGRFLGPKIYDIRWFRHIITKERIERLHHYYEKFGVFTFIFGRFIPGGARNALFMTAGLGKMPFVKFILRDGFACLISSTVIFSIGFSLAQNYQLVVHYFKTYNEIVIGILVLAVLVIGLRLWWTRHLRRKEKTPPDGGVGK
jgi:membrane-associated protein